jgi:hypothetical protein
MSKLEDAAILALLSARSQPFLFFIKIFPGENPYIFESEDCLMNACEEFRSQKI